MAAELTPFRLLCVSHFFESHRGGIELVAGQLARNLGDTGVAVRWAASDASPAPTDLATLPMRVSNVIERRCGLPFPLPTPSALARLLRAIYATDAVLVHDGMYPTSIAAILAARLLRRPVILVQHIGRVPGSSIAQTALFTIADRMLTRPMLRLASQVVFISATTQRHFSKTRMRREPLLVFNGVEDQIFRPSVSEEERSCERQQSGWPNDRRVILFVGRFLEKKGLLRVREMARLRGDLHWAFAGWGPCDPEAWALSNVSVHRNCSRSELASLYRCADLLVLPSKSEGFPLVVQEALACGLQPVCCEDAADADAAAAPYIVGVSNDGTEAEVVHSYLDAIGAFTGTSHSIEDRSSRAAFAHQRYSWPAAALRYRRLLLALCSNRSARARSEEACA